MIVDACAAMVNMTSVFTLNEVAAWLWQKAQEQEFTEDSLVAALCAEYEVDESTARTDVKTMLAKWTEYGWLETAGTESVVK